MGQLRADIIHMQLIGYLKGRYTRPFGNLLNQKVQLFKRISHQHTLWDEGSHLNQNNDLRPDGGADRCRCVAVSVMRMTSGDWRRQA